MMMMSIDMEKVLTEQQEKELALLTNMYYILMTGADQVLYKAEEYFDALGVAMVGKKGKAPSYDVAV